MLKDCKQRLLMPPSITFLDIETNYMYQKMTTEYTDVKDKTVNKGILDMQLN